jgi:hypothetical protein
MKRLMTFAALSLLAGMAQAGVYKCQSSSGTFYSDDPCPAGSTEGTYKPAPVADGADVNQQGGEQQMSHGGNGIYNIDAVPLPNPATERQAYQSFLSSPSPRAFIICQDGRVMKLVGTQTFIDKHLATLPAGCTPYAVNDHLAQ